MANINHNIGVTEISFVFSLVDVAHSRVPLSKWEKTGDTGTCPQGKAGHHALYINLPPMNLLIFLHSLLAKSESKWDTVVEQDSNKEVSVR